MNYPSTMLNIVLSLVCLFLFFFLYERVFWDRRKEFPPLSCAFKLFFGLNNYSFIYGFI